MKTKISFSPFLHTILHKVVAAAAHFLMITEELKQFYYSSHTKLPWVSSTSTTKTTRTRFFVIWIITLEARVQDNVMIILLTQYMLIYHFEVMAVSLTMVSSYTTARKYPKLEAYKATSKMYFKYKWIFICSFCYKL